MEGLDKFVVYIYFNFFSFSLLEQLYIFIFIHFSCTRAARHNWMKCKRKIKSKTTSSNSNEAPLGTLGRARAIFSADKLSAAKQAARIDIKIYLDSDLLCFNFLLLHSLSRGHISPTCCVWNWISLLRESQRLAINPNDTRIRAVDVIYVLYHCKCVLTSTRESERWKHV